MLKTFRDWVFGPSSRTATPQADRHGDFIQTERIVHTLSWIGLVGLSLLFLYGFTYDDPQQGFGFITWSIIAAIGASLTGSALGLLFGLPSVRRIEIVGRPGSDSQTVSGKTSLADGYSESTNLEQVADWLTKIIVGLTLTQYAQWQTQFNTLSSNLTGAMLGSDADAKYMVPGGAVVVAYFTLGFLVSYLLMRRYFIGEMVQGQKEAREKAEAERKELAVAADDGRLQTTSVMTSTPVAIEKATQSIAAKAAAMAPVDAKKEAKGLVEDLKKEADFPDDPWRGKFGGSPTAGDVTLSATVTPLESSSTNFRINMLIHATPAYAGQSAMIYLHPTFGSDPCKVAFGPDGKGTLEVFGYGAFTVGAILENGDKLELNLATLPDVPEAFRQR